MGRNALIWFASMSGERENVVPRCRRFRMIFKNAGQSLCAPGSNRRQAPRHVLPQENLGRSRQAANRREPARGLGGPPAGDRDARADRRVARKRAAGVDLHFMARLDRAKQGLGVSCEIGEAFQSRMKYSSECRLLLNCGLPSLNGLVGDTLAASPYRFDRKLVQRRKDLGRDPFRNARQVAQALRRKRGGPP